MTMALNEQCRRDQRVAHAVLHIHCARVDVASSGQDVTPWIPAKVFITSNSLQRLWVGFVWMNPKNQRRMDGLAAFEHPNCRRRLAELSTQQLRELMAALIRVRPRCAAVTDELLIALDRIGRP
jgi:hypothetical protein